MGKRKRALHKKNPDRHKAFLALRRGETLEHYFMKDGTSVY